MNAWLRFPGLRSLRGYQPAWLGRDVLAGIVLAAVCVPAGMAYAELSGLPAVYGLYASILPLVAYTVFGPSRALVMGPDSSIAPLVAATIVPLALADPGRRIVLASMLALIVGAMCLVVGLGRLGFITDLLAKPVRIGYLNGIAVVVVVSQLPKILGISASGDAVQERVVAIARGVGATNPATVAIGAGALAVILVLRAFAPKVPGALIAVVGALVVSSAMGLSEQGVKTLGMLPQGLPTFRLPMVGFREAIELAGGALGIAVIALTDTSVLSQALAARKSGAVDANEEFAALGIANAAAGLFQGFPVSASSSRSATNASARAKTQAAGLVAAIAIGVLLVAAPGLLGPLPLSVLGAVIIDAGIGMADVRGTWRLWGLRRTEFWLSIISFLGVVLLGVLPGVFVAVALSVLNFMRRQWWPHDAVLGRAPGVKGYHDVGDFTEARQVPGLLLWRFDAPLFFANAAIFHKRLDALVEAEGDTLHRVVIAAEPITDVDTTAADTLTAIIKELQEDGIEFGFAELKHPVAEQLRRYGILELVGEDMLFPTLGSAVHDYVHSTEVEWIDWEDEEELANAAEAEQLRD